MFKSIFLPNKHNSIIWANALFLLAMLLAGKASALVILFAYFLETIIIGIFNFLKMLVTHFRSKKEKLEGEGNGIFLSFFFLFHYGFFVAVQSVFGFVFFSFGNEWSLFKEPFDLIENYGTLLRLENMGFILASIFGVNLAYFYTNFWADEKYHEYKVGDLFMLPYVRIFIQQFVVILSGFFIVILSAGTVAAILLILFRLMVDLVVVSIKKNGALVKDLASNLGKNEEEKSKLKEMFEKWSE